MSRENTNEIKPYDFRTPKKATKETLKMIKDIYDNYCRLLSNRLTMMLRTSCDIKLGSVEESTFSKYIEPLNDYASTAMLEVSYNDNQLSDYKILYDIPRNLVFVALDRMLGGNGEKLEELEISKDREYTDIEMTLLNYVYDQITPVMDLAWQNTLDLETSYVRIDTKYRLGQYINYNDTVLILKIHAEINNEVGVISICFPLGYISELLSRIKLYQRTLSDTNRNKGGQLDSKKGNIMGRLQNSNLTITGVLDKTILTLKDVTELVPGDMIVLDKELGTPVELQVEGEKWFEGKWGFRNHKNVVKVTKNYGIGKEDNLI